MSRSWWKPAPIWPVPFGLRSRRITLTNGSFYFSEPLQTNNSGPLLPHQLRPELAGKSVQLQIEREEGVDALRIVEIRKPLHSCITFALTRLARSCLRQRPLLSVQGFGLIWSARWSAGDIRPPNSCPPVWPPSRRRRWPVCRPPSSSTRPCLQRIRAGPDPALGDLVHRLVVSLRHSATCSMNWS